MVQDLEWKASRNGRPWRHVVLTAGISEETGEKSPPGILGSGGGACLSGVGFSASLRGRGMMSEVQR